jgi:AraC-like DNA-binding protein
LDSVKRASIVLNVPVSVHRYSESGEESSVCHCGTETQACAFVTRLPWGPQACRKSRAKAIDSAIRRKKPVPFICHMGFSCVAMELEEESDSSVVSTFGPFQPAEAIGGLERDVEAGLEALQHPISETLPFTLDDIRAVPMEAVPATAEWLHETWQSMCMGAINSDAPTTDTIGEIEKTNSSGNPWGQPRSFPDPFSAKLLLSAVQAGNKKTQRQIIENLMLSDHSAIHFSSVKKAKTIALAGAFIYAAEESDFDTVRLRDLLPSLPKDLEKEENTAGGINILLRFVRKLDCTHSHDDLYQKLNRILDDHLETGITLDSVAKQLNCNPTTLTKDLQRTFGMSYSDYVGRMRVEHGKTLLHTTDLSISEIAKRTGLSDGSNFGKLFRKFVGLSPSEFRKQTKNK